MRITMVGTGYVGLVTGTCFANTGNHVTCLDVDERKIATLKDGKSPIFEPGLDEMIRRNVAAGRLRFTTDKQAAYEQAEIVFLCVGTPSDEKGQADLRFVLAAAQDLGEAMERTPEEKLDRRAKIVVVKSTVPVGTNARVKEAISAVTRRRFKMASNPEFLKEGAAIHDFVKPDRVVVGCEDWGTGERLRQLYEPFVRQGNPIYVMDIPSAEMVKYAANAMLATKISFINEIANLCEAYGADVDQVRTGMCSDRRIGNQFLFPGLGYGGSCFPKDVLACVSMGEQSQLETPVLAAVHTTNQRQRHRFLEKILRRFGEDLTGLRFGVWGIAFKPGTDDVREAPSIMLMQELTRRGGRVAAYDPAARETCRLALGDSIEYCGDPMEAAAQADALILCTDWDELKSPDLPQLRGAMRQAILFDGRNVYRPSTMREHGFEYFSVGRPATSTEAADSAIAMQPSAAR